MPRNRARLFACSALGIPGASRRRPCTVAGRAAAAAVWRRAQSRSVRDSLPPAPRPVRCARCHGTPGQAVACRCPIARRGAWLLPCPAAVSTFSSGPCLHSLPHGPTVSVLPPAHPRRLLAPPDCPAHSLNAAPGLGRLASNECLGVYVGRVVTAEVAEEQGHNSVCGLG